MSSEARSSPSGATPPDSRSRPSPGPGRYGVIGYAGLRLGRLLAPASSARGQAPAPLNRPLGPVSLLQGRHLPNGKPSHVGDHIHYRDVEGKHSGTYICTASNQLGKDERSFELAIRGKLGHHWTEFREQNISILSLLIFSNLFFSSFIFSDGPSIDTEKDMVNTNIGENAEIACIVHAHPRAKVRPELLLSYFSGSLMIRMRQPFSYTVLLLLWHKFFFNIPLFIVFFFLDNMAVWWSQCASKLSHPDWRRSQHGKARDQQAPLFEDPRGEGRGFGLLCMPSGEREGHSTPCHQSLRSPPFTNTSQKLSAFPKAF